MRVAPNVHIKVTDSFYSVPCALVKKEVDVRPSDRAVEVFYKSQRVASHPRRTRLGQYTTVQCRLPEIHQKQQSFRLPRPKDRLSDFLTALKRAKEPDWSSGPCRF